MTQIGIISDTHGFLHPGISEQLAACDEIWHAGDVGSFSLLRNLKSLAPLKAVYGNIDDYQVRRELPEFSYFESGGFRLFMTHIGGYPGKYAPGIPYRVIENKPDIMIAGHSHILKIIYDKKYNLLFINPGAAGKTGIHKLITMVKLTLDNHAVKELNIIEFPR
ncbi:MAG: metallophosphatase family protein [Bacteroidales bacterium]|nr:metallophosphatase family protein [Bacteroidales bacterium]MDY0284551.1 metallophosphoesterase family protein [Bacteroidales bacterium]HPE85823.1 metallophosphoesterase family protein [Bacteroidales bacterium]